MNAQEMAKDLKSKFPPSTFDLLPAETVAKMVVNKDFAKFMNNIVGPQLIRRSKKKNATT